MVPADPSRYVAPRNPSAEVELEALAKLGWGDDFAGALAALDRAAWRPARVAVEFQDQLRLIDGGGTFAARLSGVMRDVPSRLERPAVGDWVAVESAADEESDAIVHALLPRRTVFVRRAAGKRELPQVIAANIDVVFIVTSLTREFNPRRLERYVAAVHDAGATPVLVLNKTDLVDDVDRFVRKLPESLLSLSRALTSALDGTGIDTLARFLAPGETVALVGSSGVGKSAIVNRLLGAEVQATGSVRQDDHRGRHTTRNRSIIPLPGGGVLIDTPGMREFQLWSGGGAVDESFEDIVALAADCRFRDCGHDTEPDCAVRAAVEAGELSAARLGSYLKLSAEERLAIRRRQGR